MRTHTYRYTRARKLLVASSMTAFLGLSLVACGTDGDSTAAATSVAATTTTVSTSTSAETGSVVAAADAFAATLTDEQKTSLQQEYSLENAEKWSNLPQALLRGGQGRIGLQLSELDDTQLAALDTLLQAVTGSAAGDGYDEIQQLLNADDYLAANGGGTDYGSGNYYIAFLGTPSDSGTWELQFGGHHLAFANTYTDGALAGATPSFRGVEPYGTYEENGATFAPLENEQASFAAMLAGMSTEELAAAKLDSVYSDILLTPGKDWAFPTAKEGVQASTLTAEQKQLVMAAIATYVDDIDDADAATILAKYESELDVTYVSYSGSTAVTEQDDYVRIDGPSVWIEFSMQHGIVLSGNHPHSVWRDRTTDYGGTQA
ncbi:DUF3500 domain-containing protein [Rhodococcoides fascians A25f]|uniref:DUF3500 domain-containing protein n=1 Tax=Rhodococcoides fascians TaxID=1828 RepID=UPI000690EACC|nr:DUF3500 domain-containing protein [Rhodococcus fascians]QII07280.1 DUF3500 domain-containing protein [Rhodococcus fascians A25f]